MQYQPLGNFSAGAVTTNPTLWMNSLQQAGPAMPGFDYNAAFGENPWLRPTRQISSLINQYQSSLGTSGGGAGGFQTHVARPDDPEVQQYMSHVMGGQRNQLDEYVKRAAGAGIQRSGMNVRGGPALGSSLHHSAMQNLAGGYSDRFRQAMDYNKYLKGQMYSQQQNQQAQLRNLYNLQHRYMASRADWTRSMGMLRHSDWRDDVSWMRDAPNRALQVQQALNNMSRQRQQDRQNNWDWNRSRARQDQVDYALRNLSQRARSTASNSLTRGESWARELALTGLGIANPWSRSLSIR